MKVRATLFDRFMAVGFLALMLWVAIDILGTKGAIPFLLVPAFFAAAPLVVVFVFHRPMGVFLLLLLWLGAVLLFAQGLLEGETGFPGKDGSLGITFQAQPVWFCVAMVVWS